MLIIQQRNQQHRQWRIIVVDWRSGFAVVAVNCRSLIVLFCPCVVDVVPCHPVGSTTPTKGQENAGIAVRETLISSGRRDKRNIAKKM